MWVTVKTLDVDGAWSNTNMQTWNQTLAEAQARYPNIKIYDWAAVVQDDWFQTDNIHYTSAGYTERARLIADALVDRVPGVLGPARRTVRPALRCEPVADAPHMVAATTTTRRESRTWPFGSTPQPVSRCSTPGPPRRPWRSPGKGYSVVEDEHLKVLPPHPPGAVFDAEEQAKYREFKEARRGAADYMAMEGEFAKYLQDVYSADPVPREALTDECDILVVGAGLRRAAAVAQAAARPGSSTSASARRAATSAAPGTGTATRASPATSSRTATSRCSRRWATSRR